ncbi:hypothetical protein Golax_014796, partial [Gossypium laxum]|nr:hypothetical protein [Gossypium laxum]
MIVEETHEKLDIIVNFNPKSTPSLTIVTDHVGNGERSDQSPPGILLFLRVLYDVPIVLPGARRNGLLTHSSLQQRRRQQDEEEMAESVEKNFDEGCHRDESAHRRRVFQECSYNLHYGFLDLFGDCDESLRSGQ